MNLYVTPHPSQRKNFNDVSGLGLVKNKQTAYFEYLHCNINIKYMTQPYDFIQVTGSSN